MPIYAKGFVENGEKQKANEVSLVVFLLEKPRRIT